MPDNVLPLPLGPVEWHCWCGVIIKYDGDFALQHEGWVDPRIVDHRKEHRGQKD